MPVRARTSAARSAFVSSLPSVRGSGVSVGDARLEQGEVAEPAGRLRDRQRAQERDDERVAARPRERVDEVDHPLDAPSVDGGDAIERAKPGAVRGRVRARHADDGRGKPRLDADAPDVLGVSSSRSSSSSAATTVTSTFLPSRSTTKWTGLPARLATSRCTSLKLATSLPSIDTHAIARHELPVRGAPRQHDAHRRRRELAVAEEHRRVERDREDDVHRRPGEHDGDALPQRLRLERARAILGRDGRGALRLLEHVHEAAERQDPDAVLGLLARGCGRSSARTRART